MLAHDVGHGASYSGDGNSIAPQSRRTAIALVDEQFSVDAWWQRHLQREPVGNAIAVGEARNT